MFSRNFVFHSWRTARFIAIRSFCLAVLLPTALAQNAPQADTPGQRSGMSTGPVHAPVKDALSRPITAGGFVDGAPVVFSDITHVAGLDKFP
jgi:hypothetical protein